ncbi:cupin domain-containing protein [Prolixibacteraceae bacterium Z1-6]|uniref:Cupin domain-containing protein n=1 Tax=Draconibacterium aestuarii TaxID=2998507 RepID=A0A9X3J7N7_9BACT|nr:cupin domain-containing protein [Prolixibacteraceae bacterium Z1-6]
MKSPQFWIEKLALQKHPEGGWFKEVYRSAERIKKESLPADFSGDRNFSTSIYYLLEGTQFSAFHKIKSDELWHFYTGNSGVEILWIEEGIRRKEKLGVDIENKEQFQLTVPKNRWFAARLLNTNGFALVGCTVSPGFHFEDFELADKSLMNEFPRLKNDIAELIRD